MPGLTCQSASNYASPIIARSPGRAAEASRPARLPPTRFPAPPGGAAASSGEPLRSRSSPVVASHVGLYFAAPAQGGSIRPPEFPSCQHVRRCGRIHAPGRVGEPGNSRRSFMAADNSPPRSTSRIFLEGSLTGRSGKGFQAATMLTPPPFLSPPNCRQTGSGVALAFSRRLWDIAGGPTNTRG
jgi:hypothetical protein